MPRDGAIIFGDLIGKLDVLRVSCTKCGRIGSYRLNRLIEDRGQDAKVVDWLDELAGDCPKRHPVSWNDRCQAQCGFAEGVVRTIQIAADVMLITELVGLSAQYCVTGCRVPFFSALRRGDCCEATTSSPSPSAAGGISI